MKYTKYILKNTLLALLTGIICGIFGGIFHKIVDIATEVRTENPVIIFFLPIAGLIIVFLYRMAGLTKDPGTNTVLKGVRGESKIPVVMGPLIFAATTITHLFGGSAGREGAALQLGGSIGSLFSKVFKTDKTTTPILILCGMSGVFSALFGTPLTATVFCAEVCCVGSLYCSALLPCIISSFTATYISRIFGNHPVSFTLSQVPAATVSSFICVLAVGILCGLLGILFCKSMKTVHVVAEKRITNSYLRIFTGGVIIIALTFICGTYDYNGAGMDVITNAVNGKCVPYAFLLKILFTAITIGTGFKGGEIVPTFFIGSTFGCAVAPLLGLSPQFGAALGIVSLFAAVVNCPIASVILAYELFGGIGIPYFAFAIIASFAFSGYSGLYGEQKFNYAKDCFTALNCKTK